jgi:hypothetical protein
MFFNIFLGTPYLIECQLLMSFLSNPRGVIIKLQRGGYQTAEGQLSNSRGVVIKPQRGVSNSRGV